MGTATVMPLGSPIGSGQGILNLEAIKIIIEQRDRTGRRRRWHRHAK